MTHPIDAVYENGAFRILQPDAVALTEGQRVQITVSSIAESDVLQLAAEVYAGLSEDDVDEVERIALDRSRFFTGRDEH